MASHQVIMQEVIEYIDLMKDRLSTLSLISHDEQLNYRANKAVSKMEGWTKFLKKLAKELKGQNG